MSIDLTQRPPRSPRVRLGGFVTLPRILDKGRATLAGKNGEYNYNGGLDQRFFAFVKIDQKALLAQIATGQGDGELLAWILANAGHKPAPWEIAQWSAHFETVGPDTVVSKERFAKLLAEQAPARTDIHTLFDRLDLDDHLTFGGKA